MVLWHALVDGTKDHVHLQTTDPSELNDVGTRHQGPRGDGWEGFPRRGTYAEGVAWIVMTLARALHYAHRRRTYHRDVKPANVLLTLQHGPQLLDFNLADSPHSAHEAEAALHGGTLPYMAPEQIEAFLDPTLWGKVEAKADVYSLGLVFREMLTGQMPELPPEAYSQDPLRHRRHRREVPDAFARRPLS
jgi:serine/threonine protein kinase